MTEEAWDKGIDLNLNAHFQLIHKFMPVFLEQQKGNIIHFTTIAGTVGLGMGPQRHAYAAGKSGAATLTKRIGIEHSKQVRHPVVQSSQSTLALLLARPTSLLTRGAPTRGAGARARGRVVV